MILKDLIKEVHLRERLVLEVISKTLVIITISKKYLARARMLQVGKQLAK